MFDGPIVFILYSLLSLYHLSLLYVLICLYVLLQKLSKEEHHAIRDTDKSSSYVYDKNSLPAGNLQVSILVSLLSEIFFVFSELSIIIMRLHFW